MRIRRNNSICMSNAMRMIENSISNIERVVNRLFINNVEEFRVLLNIKWMLVRIIIRIYWIILKTQLIMRRR